jgi:FMN-dependent NADH-azoreductase
VRRLPPAAPERRSKRFAAADAYLFSVPMWNAGIPYVSSSSSSRQPAGHALRFDPVHG